jgi:hypothetical protein
MFSCSIWFSAPSFWVDGGLESRCVGRVCTANTTYAAALKTTIHPKTRCRKPYATTQHLMLLMWAYVLEICRAKYTLLKNDLVASSWHFKLFHFVSRDLFNFQPRQRELETDSPVTFHAVVVLMLCLLFLFYFRIYLFVIQFIILCFTILVRSLVRIDFLSNP